MAENIGKRISYGVKVTRSNSIEGIVRDVRIGGLAVGI